MSIFKMLYDVTDKLSWQEYKNSIGKYLSSIILDKLSLQYRGLIRPTNTSTNAVCQTDDLIIKIYAPEICGYNAYEDFKREVYALQLMKTRKILVPTPLAYGTFNCNHIFYYCIMNRINLPTANEFVATASVYDVSNLIDKLQKVISEFQSLKIEMTELSKIRNSSNKGTFVHGDLTGENVLYDGETIAIIDFEDWQYTAPEAELPAIIFEMLYEHIDDVLLSLGYFNYEELKEKLFIGIKSHYDSKRFESAYLGWLNKHK